MIIVGRPINSVSINGLEFLLDDNGNYMEFESREVARDFLRENAFPEATDEELETFFSLLTPEEVEAYERGE